MTTENISISISIKECCRTLWGSNLQTRAHQSDMNQTEPPWPAYVCLC